MKGVVLDFSEDTAQGLISGEDGNRYSFSGMDWKPERFPGSGMHVDFEADERRAVNIYLDPHMMGLSVTRNRVTASLLAFFFGWLGFHKYYLGLNKPATIMLCISLGGIILLGLPTFVMMIIGFAEFLIYVSMSDEQFEHTYITGRKEWF